VESFNGNLPAPSFPCPSNCPVSRFLSLPILPSTLFLLHPVTPPPHPPYLRLSQGSKHRSTKSCFGRSQQPLEEVGAGARARPSSQRRCRDALSVARASCILTRVWAGAGVAGGCHEMQGRRQRQAGAAAASAQNRGQLLSTPASRSLTAPSP